MLIDIHAIQNHSPANLNRDDLGSPKSCYFGGVLRTRISSQCLKRSIRMSNEFKSLLGGVRTRRLASLIEERIPDAADKKRVIKVLQLCGIKSKEDDKTDMLIYTTHEAIQEIAAILENGADKTDEELAKAVGEAIVARTAVPDMALSGRMLETGHLKDTKVDAALQVAHAISTHEARPEVDYYVAADDIPGDDPGAGYVDEAMFASACFYKYFSINWETLLNNLTAFPGNVPALAAHTVGSFILASAVTTPSGKQNSFAAHNPPDGMLIEIKDSPLSYANAFARPVTHGERDIISQSIAQLGQYIHDIDIGYGPPKRRFWFSPNHRYPLNYIEGQKELPVTDTHIGSIHKLVEAVVAAMGYAWHEVQQVVINTERDS